MTFRRGLLWGFLGGLGLVGVSMGYVNVTQRVREIAQFSGMIGVSLALLISIIRQLKKGSVFNPKIDGFFIGLSIANSLVSFALYGVSFP